MTRASGVSLPAKEQSGRDIYVNLNDPPYDPTDARSAVRTAVGELPEPAARRLIGALSTAAGNTRVGTQFFVTARTVAATLGPPNDDVWRSRLAIAEALASDVFFVRAALALDCCPASSWSGYPRWAARRTFYLRESGHIGRAILTARSAARVTVHEHLTLESAAGRLQLAYLAVEAIVLGASSRSPARRGRLLAAAKTLLDECERLLDRFNTIWRYELPFYRAEIALLEGDARTAVNGYRLYRAASEHWLRGEERAIACRRESAALGALGERREAAAAWATGARAAWSRRSLVHVVQYVVTLPMLASANPKWLWRARRASPLFYRAREKALVTIRRLDRGAWLWCPDEGKFQ